MLYNESVLHYIWKYRLFNQTNLHAFFNQELEIISPGVANTDAGSDFYHAKIKIDETLWVGNVEIHIRSSDWLKHKHQFDKAYDNVILHVVWINDADIYRTDGTLIPVLELNQLVSEDVLNKINSLSNHTNWIACENQIRDIDEFAVSQWLERMMIERLEDKSNYIAELYESLKGNWEDTFYISLARSFGFKVNAAPFEMLAKSLPQQLFAKHKHNPLQIEAIIFGVAGLLNSSFKDEYPNHLKREFSFLKAKYQLQSMEAYLWKFARTRPDNFPSVRLAQFAGLIIKSSHLFSKTIEAKNYKELISLFNNLPINDYWKNHYMFDQDVKKASKNIGESSVNNILINTVAPLIFFYGKRLGNEAFKEKATELLINIKPEKNNIILKFNDLGMKIETAFESQAVLQLKKFYCDQKKCLNCGIGNKILRS